MDPLKPIPKLLPKCLKRGNDPRSGHVAVLNEPCNTPTLNLPSDHLIIFISFLCINPVPRTSLLCLLCRSRRIDWSTLVEILGGRAGASRKTACQGSQKFTPKNRPCSLWRRVKHELKQNKRLCYKYFPA